MGRAKITLVKKGTFRCIGHHLHAKNGYKI